MEPNKFNQFQHFYLEIHFNIIIISVFPKCFWEKSCFEGNFHWRWSSDSPSQQQAIAETQRQPTLIAANHLARGFKHQHVSSYLGMGQELLSTYLYIIVETVFSTNLPYKIQSSMYHYNWQLTIRWFVFWTVDFALVSFPSILHIDLISPSFLQANSKGTLAALIHLSIYVGEMLLSISPNPNLLNTLEIVQRLPPESHSAIICAL